MTEKQTKRFAQLRLTGFSPKIVESILRVETKFPKLKIEWDTVQLLDDHAWMKLSGETALVGSHEGHFTRNAISAISTIKMRQMQIDHSKRSGTLSLSNSARLSSSSRSVSPIIKSDNK